MRVTENTNFNTIRDSINTSKARMEKNQFQAATLKKLNTPSDNPVGAGKLLEVRTDKVNEQQFLANSKLAQTYLEHTDHALEELTDIVVRAKEIAINQASGASSNEQSRAGVAEEIGQLYQQAISVANRRIGDRYIFGGYQTSKPAVDDQGHYKGDEGKMNIEVSRDVYIAMNLPGSEVFNTKTENNPPSAQARALAGAEGEPANAPVGQVQSYNIFDELQRLRISLLTGDLGGIRDSLEKFDDIHANVVSNRTKIGSRSRGLENATNSLERHAETNAKLSSEIEDADMATVMTDLAREETILRGTLASSKRLVQPTLMDFLR